MTISLFSKKNDYVECKLCPHRCHLRDGDTGKCSVRKCDGDAIFLSNYGELVSIAVNPIHKKPFRLFLPDTKTLSVGGVGCSLDCKFCENYKISQPKINHHPETFTAWEITEMAYRHQCESVCMTFNEPTISFEYLMDLAEACHDNDLKFILKTNAYVNKEPWSEICRVTDAMNIDWKGYDSQYRCLTGASDFVIMDRIKEAHEAGVHLEISVPLYCSYEEDIRKFSECGRFLASLDKNIPCHLSRVTPAYLLSDVIPIDDESVKLSKDIFSSHMNNVFME